MQFSNSAHNVRVSPKIDSQDTSLSRVDIWHLGPIAHYCLLLIPDLGRGRGSSCTLPRWSLLKWRDLVTFRFLLNQSVSSWQQSV